MADLLTSAQMRAIEAARRLPRHSDRAGPWSGRAGGGGGGPCRMAAFRACGGRGGGPPPNPREYLGQEKGHTAVVFAGPATTAATASGKARPGGAGVGRWEVFLCGDPDRLPPDARANFERWREIGAVRALRMADVDLFAADLAVDALFGTGLTRPLDGEALKAANALAARPSAATWWWRWTHRACAWIQAARWRRPRAMGWRRRGSR
ncbi:MAG: NAD(P)H-hydrate epimerase [Paracoccaceae bacterium]